MISERITDIDRAVIREIEGDIPLKPDPYGAIAEKVGCDRQEVVHRLKKLQRKGWLRRIGAVLYHRDSGYNANGMLVCQVPEDDIERLGMKLAGLKEVSHCYQRKKRAGWPYNLYAMIHGRSKAEVENTVAEFTENAAVNHYEVLYSTEEILKRSFRNSSSIQPD